MACGGKSIRGSTAQRGRVWLLTGLEAADKVPLDAPGEQLGLLAQLLLVVLAKVRLRGLVEGQDVVGGLQLGHGHEPDLGSALAWAFDERSAGEWLMVSYIPALGGGGDPLADALELGDQGLGPGGVYPHLCLLGHGGPGVGWVKRRHTSKGVRWDVDWSLESVSGVLLRCLLGVRLSGLSGLLTLPRKLLAEMEFDLSA